MNGGHPGALMPSQADVVSTDVPADLKGVWESVRTFVRTNREKADQQARDRYNRESSAIRQQGDEGAISEGEERKRLERATKQRDETLALNAKMWRSLEGEEKAIREKARQAARDAVAAVWRSELDRLQQDFPDHAHKPAISYP